MHQELDDYIKKEKNKGFTKEQIRNVLVKVGHDEEVVEEHLKHFFKEKTNFKYVIIAIVAMLILISVIGAYFLKSTPEEDYNRLGWGLFDKEKFEEAIVMFEKTIQENPNNLRSYEGIGSSYRKLGEYEKAVENLNNALSIDNNSARAYKELGKVYFSMEDYDKAIGKFEKVIEINGGDTGIFDSLGLSYFRVKNYGKAIEYFEQVIKQNPTEEKAYRYLGQVYFENGEYNKAIEYFENAIKLNTTDSQAYEAIGRSYLKKHEFEKAIGYLKKAEELAYDDIFIKLKIAWATYLLSGYNEAEIIIDYVIEHNPRNCNAYYLKGLMFYLEKNYNKSIYYLSESLNQDICDTDLFPSILKAEAVETLGRVYFDLKDFKKAIEYFKESINTDSNYYKSYYGLAFIYFRTGDIEKSQYYFQEGTKRNLEGRNDWNGLNLSEIQ